MFNIAFPVGGFFFSIISSVVLQYFGEREDLYMLMVLTAANIFGLMSLLPYEATQLIAAIIFGPVRTLQWSCYFHFYAIPSRYPVEVYGRLLGYSNLVIALVGDGLPYLLNAYVSNGANQTITGVDDVLVLRQESPAGRYEAVHLSLQILTLISFALPFYLTCTRRSRRNRA